MKISKRIPSCIPLILSAMVLMLSFLLTKPAIAQGTVDQKLTPYQSSFESYKPLTEENLSDWKVLNQQAATNEKSMPGMSENSDMANMLGMDMGKSTTKSGSSAMSSMKGMDHSKMPGMNMGDINAKSGSLDMANMPGMDMGKSTTKSDSSDMSNMKGIDHSKMPGMYMRDMNAKSGSRDVTNTPSIGMGSSTLPPDSSEMSRMEGQDHSKMKTTNAASALKNKQVFQIIPNFHPFAVHFPIVLITIAFLFSMIASVLRKHPLASQLASTGHFSLWAAAPATTLAAILGWLAFNSVNHDDVGHAAMLLHRVWAIPTVIGILLLATWDIWKHRSNQIMSIPILLILSLLSGAMLVTGWLGGEVVYRHGIGVMSMPANEVTEASGHEHTNSKVVKPASSQAKPALHFEGESHAN